MEARMIPKGTLLYRSFNHSSKRDGYWFSLHQNDTYGYGQHTAEFRVTKDLILIDITHSKCYSLIKDALINMTEMNNEIKDNHAYILFPLGFDDTVFYLDMAKISGIDVDSFTLNPSVHTESILYFNGRSRLSIHEYDIKLVLFLKKAFGDMCNGIASLKPFPDIIRNGMQPSELCVFDTSDIEYVRDVSQHMPGGGKSIHPPVAPLLPPLFLNNEFIRKHSDNSFIDKLDVTKLKIKLNIIKKPFDELINHTIMTDNSNIYDTTHLPPLYLDNEFIRKTSDLTRINELMKRNIKSNIKLNIIPLDEALNQINNPNDIPTIKNNTYKKIKTTRKRKNK